MVDWLAVAGRPCGQRRVRRRSPFISLSLSGRLHHTAMGIDCNGRLQWACLLPFAEPSPGSQYNLYPHSIPHNGAGNNRDSHEEKGAKFTGERPRLANNW